jgi:hypothetical protein
MPGERATRREFLHRAAVAGAGAAVAAAVPLTSGLPRAEAAGTALGDGTLQAVYDTLIPGRKVTRTVSGGSIHRLAILGLDPEPGAVEADALALGHDPKIGFDVLAPVFLADLETRALAHGGAPFLRLARAGREATLIDGLAYDNPTRLVWEAAAAVAFAAFCGVASPQQTMKGCPGYAVMGLPGAAPNGYGNASFGRRLSHERTPHGSLP